MAYNELVKNFNRIRDYMREFYVYGSKAEKNTPEKARDLMMMKNSRLGKLASAII